MSKWVKRVLSVVLVCVLVGGAVPLGVIPVNAARKFGDDGEINWDFIEPVIHQKSAPVNYIGIYTSEDLSDVRNNLSSNFILMSDIDLGNWDNWEPIRHYLEIMPSPLFPGYAGLRLILF